MTGGTITIYWDSPKTAAINISGGAAWTVNGNPVTFPYSLRSRKVEFATSSDGTYEVSVKLFGIEIADTPDKPRVVQLSNGSALGFRPTLDQLSTDLLFQKLDDSVAGMMADPTSETAIQSRASIGAQIASSRPTPLPVGKLFGGNIVPVPGCWGWRDLCSTWDWENWIKPQIQRASVLGMNSVRLILSPSVTLAKLSTGGSSAPAITVQQWHDRLSQIALYLDSLGMTFYPCLATASDFTDRNANHNSATHSETVATNYQDATVLTTIVDTAAFLAGFGNVILFDVFQENGTDVTAADILAAMTAIRAVARRVPITSSLGSEAWTNTALPNSHVLYDYAEGVGSDFIDVHSYAATAGPTAPDFAIDRSRGKRLVIGEFGSSVADGSTLGTAIFANAASIHNRHDVLGSYAWALADQKDSGTPAQQFGVWDNTGFVAGASPLLPGIAPLSITSGKRTYLTDALKAFNRTDHRIVQYGPQEILPLPNRRPSKMPLAFSIGSGSASLAAHPLGLKMTSSAAGTIALDSPLMPVSAGRAYRASAQVMRDVANQNRSWSLGMLLYDATGAFVDSFILVGAETAGGAARVPDALSFLLYVDPSRTNGSSVSWSTITQARFRVLWSSIPASSEVHYLCDGASVMDMG